MFVPTIGELEADVGFLGKNFFTPRPPSSGSEKLLAGPKSILKGWGNALSPFGKRSGVFPPPGTTPPPGGIVKQALRRSYHGHER